MIKPWIEAMRLRTLPVSLAGVVAGIGCAVWHGCFSVVAAVLCLLFALFAQVASNFGNEYYDFVNVVDKRGREGFRRGVTEGDIAPRDMKRATFLMLVAAALVGCAMLPIGGWWLLPVGCVIVLFALAYSAGPYPLSHHGLGDIAVVLFFGIVPVNLTCYLQCGSFDALALSFPVSLAVGLLAANVLIVNNYRDEEDDRSVGKHTTVVIFGGRVMGRVYLLSGFVAMFVMLPVWLRLPVYAVLVPVVYLCLHTLVWRKLVASRGAAINPLLGRTAINLLLFSLLLFVVFLLATKFSVICC